MTNNSEDLERRVSKLEDALDDIKNELKERAINDALSRQTLEQVQSDTREIRTEMLNLMYKILDSNKEEEGVDKAFYRRLILIVLSILATLLLAAFGIKEIFIL